MMEYKYVLRPVSLEEYTRLKVEESDLIAHVHDSFNDTWKEKTKNVSAIIKYNTTRSALGIFLVENSVKDRLVLNHTGLSEIEEAVIRSFYDTLEKRLDMLRIYKENWDEYPESTQEISSGLKAPGLHSIDSDRDDEIPF